jgi:hypothetical protein
LRGLLNIEVLRQLGFEVVAVDLKSVWTTLYPEHKMTEFEADIEPVTRWLLNGPYALWNGSLRGTVNTGAVDAAARDELKRLNEGGSPQSGDFRVLFVAARLAYEDNRAAFRPEERVDGGWKEGSWPNLIERQMNGSIDSKVRAFERPLTSVQTENRRAHREAVGAALLKELVPGLG